MSIELPSVRDQIEKQLTNYAARAVILGKLALLKGVNKLVGDIEVPDEPFIEVPTQHQYKHDSMAAKENLSQLNVLERCEIAFNAATAMQMDTEKSILRSSNVFGAVSEYIAISGPRKPKLFLHRPAIDAQTTAPYPYWFSDETVSNDVETGLPTIHYRETVVDQLGNLQAKEWIEDRRQVLRPLDEYESIPFLEALNDIRIYPIAGFTEKADSA